MNTLAVISHKLKRLRKFLGSKALCAAILTLMGVNLLSNASLKSLTNDEFVHIPSAHRYLVEQNFSLNPEHPPLAKVWAALPLSLIHVKYYRTAERNNQDFAVFTGNYSGQFWELNQQRWWQIVFWSRVPMVLLTLALGVVIYLYGTTFFTERAAILSVALFSLEPTMLGHGWIVHTDVPAAFAYLFFFLMLGRYWVSPTFARAMWLGLAAGVALLIKFSLIIIVPIFFGVLVYGAVKRNPVRSPIRQVAQSALAAICTGVLVNAAYFFQRPKLTHQDSSWALANAGSPATGEWLLNLFNSVSKIVPTYYLFGVLSVYIHNRHGHHASLLGHYGSSGWWYYFPVAFALKTSLPFLLFTIAALSWSLWAGLIKRDKALIPLLAAFGLYLTIAMTSRINIGIRHIAPVFPFLFLLGGICLDRFLNTDKLWKTVLVVVLFAFMLLEAGRAYPHYLSFMNSLTFGKPGWQFLSDSNIEWGQDTGAMARYLREKGETSITAALAGGWLTPHGIHIVDYPPPDLQSSPTRYVAIGAASLNGSIIPTDLKDKKGTPLTEDQRINYFSKYRALTPERVFGNSIYLYRKAE